MEKLSYNNQKNLQAVSSDYIAEKRRAQFRIVDDEYESRAQSKKVASYFLELDRQKYADLRDAGLTGPDYQEELIKLNEYTHFQLRTHIGERLNVLQSTFRYDIVDGQLWGENMNETAIESFKRGRDHRRLIGKECDFPREDAEITGMTQIENTLTSPSAAVGTTMVSISPSGGEESTYTHNFYDVFTLKEDNGERYIEANRYSTSLSPIEFEEKAKILDPEYELDSDKKYDAAFLKNPITVKGNTTPEEIQRILHQEHSYLDSDNFELVIDGLQAYFNRYTRTLESDPHNEHVQGMLYNAILNKADALVEHIENAKKQRIGRLVEVKQEVPDEEVAYYAAQQVRESMDGCGYTGGYEMTLGGLQGAPNSPFSVVTFGAPDMLYSEKRTLKCKSCPLCNKSNIVATIEGGRIHCPACKGSAPYSC